MWAVVGEATLVRFCCAAALALLSLPAFAQECPVATISNSVLRQAPGPGFAQIGSVPAGTAVLVDVCFDRGAFCAVTAPAGTGFISGDLLALRSGRTLRSLEAERWAKIDANEPAGPAAYDRCNIVVWGDSLPDATFGRDLQRLLGRSVSLQGVAGEDAKVISARMLADIRYEGRIAIFWVRHADNQSVEQYMADLTPMVEKLRQSSTPFIVVSDVADLEGSPTGDAGADATTTDAINDALRAAFPGNFLDVTAVLSDPATRSDGLELSADGQSAVAGAIAAFIQQKGW